MKKIVLATAKGVKADESTGTLTARDETATV
jgi:hypothetical protein